MAITAQIDSGGLLYLLDGTGGMRRETVDRRFLTPVFNPVIDTTPYVVGQYLALQAAGTPVCRYSNGGGKILSLRLFDKSNNTAALTCILFRDTVSTVFAAHGTNSLVAADIPKIIGHIEIVAGDYRSVNGQTIATKQVSGLPFQVIDSISTLFVVFVAQSTPTYLSASDLALFVGIESD